MPLPVLIVSILVNRFSNKLAPDVPNNTLKIPPFCSFASFLIVLLTTFIIKSNYLGDLTVFMMPFISSFEIINVIVPYPNIFLLIATSVAYAVLLILMVLKHSFIPFFMLGNPAFSNGHKSLPKNLLDCSILYHCVLDKFTLAEELFAKASRRFETCVLENDKLCGKLFSSLESQATFDQSFKVTSPIFITDWNI